MEILSCRLDFCQMVCRVLLAGAATSIIFVVFFSIAFVATKVCLCLSRQNIFVPTKLFSQQTRVCRDKTRHKHTFVTIKDVFCRDKHAFVATKMMFVATPVNDSRGLAGRVRLED